MNNRQIENSMGEIRILIKEKLNSIPVDEFNKIRETLIEDTKDKIQELKCFIDDNYDVIKDVLLSIEDVIAFNAKNGTNLYLDIVDLLEIGETEAGRKVMNFFNSRGVELKIMYDKTEDILLPRVNINNNEYNFELLMSGYLFKSIQMKTLEKLNKQFSNYINELKQRLRMNSDDLSLKTIYEYEIEWLGGKFRNY